MKRLGGLATVGVLVGCLVAPPTAASDTVPAANVNMVGEAFTVRQDGTFPTEVLLARYPRAVTEVSDDLSTGFASFADPGFLLRFGIGSGFATSGKRELSAPTWAECLYPQSPGTPTAETRAPGGGLGPTAVAACQSRGSHLAGYATQAAPDGAQAGNLRGGPLTATVDTAAAPDGTTEVVAASEINDLTIGGAVTLRSIRNRAVATTTGRPGGAVAKAEATIGALLVNGEPVALPSDSIQSLGPALAAIGPVVAPAGTFTFDVVPELVEAAADGTEATARAAQITVTLRTGQATTTFGLGYARAGARTIVNEPIDQESGLDDGIDGLTPPEPAPGAAAPSGADPFPANGPAFGAGETSGAGLGFTAQARPTLPAISFLPPPAATAVPIPPVPTPATEAPAPPTGTATPSVILPPAAPATAIGGVPGGPSKGFVALLGTLVAAVLVRYLSFSTKLRRL